MWGRSRPPRPPARAAARRCSRHTTARWPSPWRRSALARSNGGTPPITGPRWCWWSRTWIPTGPSPSTGPESSSKRAIAPRTRRWPAWRARGHGRPDARRGTARGPADVAATKTFTVEGANRSLPLVRRIVQDIVAEHPRWKDLVSRYELAAAGARPEWGESPEQLALRHDIDAVAQRINGYVDELAEVGCLLKGFEDGLVDFYGLREGQLVFLCWRLGEDSVAHWHELDAGVAGRQPITPEFVAAEKESPS
ncbi:MAG: hypothetical protein B7Z72_06985 [Gemmatimonadetes bacterium 21-71-4]|nr:MAG: hypothetical protein B7Z72_06985 [Gemmatimonadetes bacterium 21-71-4]